MRNAMNISLSARKWWIALALPVLVVVTAIAIACGSTETVVQTVVVEKSVPGETVVQTVVVEKAGGIDGVNIGQSGV